MGFRLWGLKRYKELLLVEPAFKPNRIFFSKDSFLLSRLFTPSINNRFETLSAKTSKSFESRSYLRSQPSLSFPNYTQKLSERVCA